MNENPNGSIFSPTLLRSESPEQFANLLEALKRDVEPQDFIEQIYVEEIAQPIWEILRHRRYKTAIINNAFRAALENILRPILSPPGTLFHTEHMKHLDAKKLAHDWFYSQEIKDQVSALLKQAGFDDWAVEAEAYRLMLSDLEKFDRNIASAETRRDRNLRNISRHREILAKKLQKSSDRLLDEDGVPSIASGAET